MSYENILIREATGENWSLDRTEATADWFDHDNLPVPVLAEPDAPQPLPSIAGKTEGEARESTQVVRGTAAMPNDSESRGGQNLCSVGDSDTDVRVFPAVSETPQIYRSEPLVGSGSDTLDCGERLHASATVGSIPTTSDLDRGSEQEPYTYEEAETRRKEAHED